ncbi:glutamate--tRNA ligase family protein [Cyclobacterium jeungdonense]|uniref:Glutamate--tRNA ligase family protein n=1 Tax=Cyclobacterium jeungdonense TaxID=708087 RepID=A0ABT8CBI9_9BACT|nr:glutamate--tRNA ligase family protein [Cyclobacterium jeungdonense]MDN3689163.1 glutamate--tRNA ligase family protein [Cyclobacterium jeungdonense]
MHPVIQKTRLAPTPSGFLHLGNVISFLITVSLAKKHQAKILLRIDDLDQKRTRVEYIQDIFDTLDLLEIPYDEGPRSVSDLQQNYSQIHRLPHYKQLLEELALNQLVFACNCSRKKIRESHPKGRYTGQCLTKNVPLSEQGVSWRLKTVVGSSPSMNRYPNSRQVCQIPDSMNFFIVKKKDGDPAYQLTSVADDHYFGVDFIVRGQDLWDSSCAQLHLSSLMPYNPLAKTTFFHHPLLMEGMRKLSKSEGALAIRTMRKSGMKKEAILTKAASFLGIQIPIRTVEEFIPAYLDSLANPPFNHRNLE